MWLFRMRWKNADQVIDGIVVSNRTLGFVNAPSLLQKAVAKCLDEKTNLAFYDENRKMLYEGLQKLGFHCIKPEGAFYMWVKSPEADEEKFVAKEVKKYNIIMVKGGHSDVQAMSVLLTVFPMRR